MLWQGSSVYIIWSRSGSVTNKVRHGSARFCRKQQYHFTAYFACFQLLFLQKTTQKPCRFCHFDHDKRKRWGPKTSPTRNPKRRGLGSGKTCEALADALPGWIPLRQQEAHHTNGPRWGMSWLAPHGVKQHLEDWDLQPPLEVICRPCNQIWGKGCPRNFFTFWVHEFWVEQKPRLNELIFLGLGLEVWAFSLYQAGK